MAGIRLPSFITAQGVYREARSGARTGFHDLTECRNSGIFPLGADDARPPGGQGALLPTRGGSGSPRIACARVNDPPRPPGDSPQGTDQHENTPAPVFGIKARRSPVNVNGGFHVAHGAGRWHALQALSKEMLHDRHQCGLELRRRAAGERKKGGDTIRHGGFIRPAILRGLSPYPASHD